MGNPAKRIVSVIMVLLMTAVSSAGILAEGLENFTQRDQYTDTVFNDVKSDDWFYENVASVYEYGLMNGKGAGRFDPQGNITVAETLTIAARLHAIYTKNSTEEFTKSSPWYKVYVDYCEEAGITANLTEGLPEDLNEQASRGLFAAILANSFPESEFTGKNNVPDNAIPDVDIGDEYAAEIYRLYRSGITVGSDKQGNFYPERSIRRSEVAAIITRIVDPSLRQSVSLAEITIYVAPDGDDTRGDGTEGNPYATILAARDAVRKLDKSQYSGITVFIAAGTYSIGDTIVLEDQDGGTEACPVTYAGEKGTLLTGGIVISPAEFKKAEGDTLLRFPEEVRDSLVMLDLTRFGYNSGDIANMQSKYKYYQQANIITVDGRQMSLARYPNAGASYGDGWIEIESGYFIDKNGNYTEKDDNQKGDDVAVETIINYGEAYMDRILSWSPEDRVFTKAHYRFIWCSDDTSVTEFYSDKPEFRVPYAGGYIPVPNGLVYFYNVPEELDAPNEFFIDDDAVLYYYPGEGFDRAFISLPRLNGPLFRIEGDYVTLESLELRSTLKNGIDFEADHLTFDHLTVTDMYGKGIYGEGENITVSNSELFNLGHNAIQIKGGDAATLRESGIRVYNNYVHDWCNRNVMAFAIDISGCGSLVDHNEVCDSTDLAIAVDGPLHCVEYNFVHDTCLFFADGATVSVHGYAYGTVVRYNLVANTGFESKIDIVGVQAYTADMDAFAAEFISNIAYNCTGSGITLAYSRDAVIRNNLVVRPGRFGYGGICYEYTSYLLGEKTKEAKVKDYLQSDLWLERFPQLKGLHGVFDPENPYDRMFIKAPANNVVKDNFLYFDKGYRTIGADYNVTKMIDFESPYYDVSDMQVPDLKDGTIIQYSSKRSHYTLDECLSTANEVVGIMTEEQFNGIGRVGIGIGNFDFDK